MTERAHPLQHRDDYDPEKWTGVLPVDGDAEDNLADEFESVVEFVDAYTEGFEPKDVDQIGDTRRAKLVEWIEEHAPQAERRRRENLESFCTEYTLDHGLDDTDPDTFTWAFVCPKCDTTNPLKGNPDGFAGRPFRCINCSWVPLLDPIALNRWRKNTDEVPV